MKINLKAFKIAFVLPVILVIMLVAAKCPFKDDCEDVMGSWSITEVSDETDCDGGIYTYHYTATITQDDCDITVTIAGESYSGEVDGDDIEWTGSYSEGGGTTTTTISLTVSGDSVSGTASWTWTDGFDSCSGTSTITGSKL